MIKSRAAHALGTRCPASATIAAALVAVALAPAGCGPYDTADYRVPRERVRTIETLDLPADDGEATTRAVAQPTPTTLPVVLPPPERPISLVDVRELALANNLDLRVSRLDPLVAAAALDAEEAAFDTIFQLNGSYGKTDQPTASQLVGSSVEDIRITPGIVQPLRTGGVLTAEVPVSRFETSNEFALLNPAYESDLALGIDQPLLRGFGADANEQQIRIATAQYGQALVRQKLDVIAVLSAADRTYWLLYAAARAVDVQQQQYDLAVAQLERARRQTAEGAVAEVEVLRAESNVADALERLIQARQLSRERQRQLKAILNDSSLPLDGATRLIPATAPEPLFYQLDIQALEQAALSRRMELLEAELRIAEQTAVVLAARNARLPDLSFQYRWNANGLGEDVGDALDQAGSLDFQDHRIGATFEMPIGNRVPRARLRSALLRRLQQLATREARILEVRQEVFDAADRLQTGWQQIVAAERRVDLSQRLYDAETRRFDIGLATGLEVSVALADLASAQFAQIEAVTNYQIAQIDLAVATGTVIGKNRVLLDIPE